MSNKVYPEFGSSVYPSETPPYLDQAPPSYNRNEPIFTVNRLYEERKKEVEVAPGNPINIVVPWIFVDDKEMNVYENNNSF